MFRPIYEPRTRAREYCDLAVNIYTGCNHGCVYCYAPRVLKKAREDFERVEPCKDIVESVQKQLTREGMKDKKIMLCFTCDPYPALIDTTPTREVIQAIKESGNHVQILTKSGMLSARDFDLLDVNDSYGVTFSGDGAQEPNAAWPHQRLMYLEEAKKRGIKTWVSCEPVLDQYAIYELISTADYIDLFKIGKLNHYKLSDFGLPPIDWREFGKNCEHLCKLHKRDYYIKEDLRAAMAL